MAKKLTPEQQARVAKEAQSWLGKVSGHVSAANRHFREDERQRKDAEKNRNIILTEREVRGLWDANRVLLTTLGGKPRPITADDLAVFRRNMEIARKRLGKTQGITARQVIDLASSNPLNYEASKKLYASDIEKARSEITMAMPVSANNGTVRFMTNAGPGSEVSRHTVIVRFNEWDSACADLASTWFWSKTSPEKVARKLLKTKLAFDCDCGRHRYFFRYIASIGGFAAGRKETGYPKIRNPNLNGVACKHVLRVMAEIDSGRGVTLGFITKHLAKASEYQAKSQMTQKQAEKALKDLEPAAVQTTAEKRREAIKKAFSFGLKKAVNSPKPQEARDTLARSGQASRAQGERATGMISKLFGIARSTISELFKKG